MGSHRRGEVRLEIERMLTEYDRITKLTGKRIPGFKVKIAKRFGVTRQRVTNIARELGLTRPQKEQRAKKQ